MIRGCWCVWVGPAQRVRQTRWRPCERVATDGSSEQRCSEQRCIRETIYEARGAATYCQIAADPTTLPQAMTWDLMTNQSGKIT